MAPGESELIHFHLASEEATVTKFKDPKGLLAKHPINSRSSDSVPFVTKKYDVKYKWRKILLHLYAHLSIGYIVYLALFCAQWSTLFCSAAFMVLGGLGLSAGSHRLFSHRSYKANTPLKILLLIMHCIANQYSVHKWVRDHRLHHKYHETDADPYNSKRGFFFSQIGWLFVNKHPDVIEKGSKIDMSDITSDPYCMFQSRYFEIFGTLFCFVIPTMVPWYFFGEDLVTSWYLAGILKFLLNSHFTYVANSFGHTKGTRPYDISQDATDNKYLKYVTLGDSFHNYHHAFPWSCTIPETGVDEFNFTTKFIDAFSLIGWTYDKKTVPLDMVKNRVLRSGDGSHRFSKEQTDENHFWGWGDKDMIKEEEKYDLSK